MLVAQKKEEVPGENPRGINLSTLIVPTTTIVCAAVEVALKGHQQDTPPILGIHLDTQTPPNGLS